MHVVYLCHELVGLAAAEKSWAREDGGAGRQGDRESRGVRKGRGEGAHILHVVYSGYHAEPGREGVRMRHTLDFVLRILWLPPSFLPPSSSSLPLPWLQQMVCKVSCSERHAPPSPSRTPCLPPGHEDETFQKQGRFFNAPGHILGRERRGIKNDLYKCNLG